MNKAEWIATRDHRNELGDELANGDEAIARKPAYVYDGTYFIEHVIEGIYLTSYVVTVGNESETFDSLKEAEDFLWSRVECDPNYDE